MKSPNFLIIGVQKAGTTSIYHYLKQHPQVYMSPIKETNFLEKDWEKVELKNKSGIDTWEKYLQLFEDARDEEVALGEASPNYLFHYQSSAQLIRHYVPEAKLIAMLRNPVQRAYSDYLMHIRDEIGEQISIAEEIKLRPNSSFLLRKGLYYQQLKYYFDLFGKEQIKVYLYDDFTQQPLAVMQDMYRFIGVNDSFAPDMSRQSQTAQVPKSRWINQLLKKQNPLRTSVATVLKTFLPQQARQKLRGTLVNLNSQDKSKATLSHEERQQLLAFYRDDILKLQDLLERDLSNWL